MPAEWLADGAQGDFEVIASMLDQMDAAVASGEYEAAESSRLEAYAFLETGPEARLMAFAPQLKLELENLFWNGQGQHKGLAYLIKNRAPAAEIRAALLAVILVGAPNQPTIPPQPAGLSCRFLFAKVGPFLGGNTPFLPPFFVPKMGGDPCSFGQNAACENTNLFLGAIRYILNTDFESIRIVTG